MAEIWDEFDSQFDNEELQREVEDAKENGGDFKEVPSGTYEVAVDNAELKKTKTNKPMVSVWLKILNGDFRNQRIFFNQVISTDKGKSGFCIHKANEFLESLKTGVDVKFENWKQFNDMILDVGEYSQTKTYQLKYKNSEEAGGFSECVIEDVFEKGDGTPS